MKTERTLQTYLSELGLLPAQPAKRLLTLEEELAEIRARHVQRREYDRVANAVKRRRRSNAIAPNDVVEPRD